jgi:phosphoglycolate phosphatase
VGLSYGYNHGRPIAEESPSLVIDDLRAAARLRRPGHWDNVGGPSSLTRQRVHRGGHWQTLDESHQGPGPLALARLTLPAGVPARPFA